MKNAVISSNQQASMRSIGKILICYHIKCGAHECMARQKAGPLRLPSLTHSKTKMRKRTREREKITAHLNGIQWWCMWLAGWRFCVDGVFAIINHWLLHQTVKRLNKTKVICFDVTYPPLCCAMLFFFYTLCVCVFVRFRLFLHAHTHTGARHFNNARTTSSLSS